MAQALLTAVVVGVAGLVATTFFGLRAATSAEIWRHISFGIFSTLITLLAHSMMMFYLIGKGKAVKDAMAEGGLSGDQYRRIAVARKPVFSIGTLAMAATMVTTTLPSRSKITRSASEPRAIRPLCERPSSFAGTRLAA